jgi:N-acetylmuramoyl-L-alanine amidase
MPAVLLETGFISNKADEKKLKDGDFQKKTAESIYKSIVAFKEKYEGKGSSDKRSNGRTSQ